MKLRFELLMSVTAMITAVAAVAVSIVQTDVMREEAEMEREHQRLSVVPSVWLETNNSSHSSDDKAPGHFEFVIKNHGLGPASLRYFTVQREGRYLKNWVEWLSSVEMDEADQKGIGGYSYNSIPENYVLPNGEKIDAYTIRAESKLIRNIENSVNDSIYTICVCSLYENCWISKGLNLAPEPVNECKIDPAYQFRSERSTPSH